MYSLGYDTHRGFTPLNSKVSLTVILNNTSTRSIMIAHTLLLNCPALFLIGLSQNEPCACGCFVYVERMILDFKSCKRLLESF